jgi:hypothetical protein
MLRRHVFSFGVLLLGASGLVAAQERYDPSRAGFPVSSAVADDYEVWGDDLPAFVSIVDGYAELTRAGQTSRDIENVPLVAGDQIRTTRGRAEVLFDDGSSLALDEHTTLTFLSSSDVELSEGRVRALWRTGGVQDGLIVRTVAGQMIVRQAGDYRITLGRARSGEPEIEVAVSRGSAELANGAGRTVVREGTRALTIAQMAPSLPYQFTQPRDAFEAWSDDAERDRYGIESARYLPDDLRYYGGVFDRYGAWRQHASYGWVWYPRVSVGWRPYDAGRWSFVVGFGYSWVGGSRWAWPTHHYGRWDCIGTTWFWIPSRPAVTHRAVGYAVPRTSYRSNVPYYQRPVTRGARPTVAGPGPRRPDTRVVAPMPSTRPSPGTSPGRGPERREEPRAVLRRDSSRPTTARPSVPDRPEPSRPNTRGERSAPREDIGPRQQPPQGRTSTGPSRPAERPSDRGSSGDRQAAPRRSAPPASETRPAAPQRSAPRATSGPPPSGSRTPSRSSSGSSSGNARRRGGGGV